VDGRGRAVRVVYFGTPESAAAGLGALLESGYDIPLVVSQPARPSGRGGHRKEPPVARLASEKGIPVLQPDSARDPALLEQVRAVRPDVLVVVAYGRILPNSLLEVAPLGAVNVHFSLLPAYRGAAPVPWALARGETSTGVTTMRIEEALDEGGIYLQRRVEIEPGEHAPSLERRLAAVGARLLVETLEGLARGDLRPIPQDPARASYAPRLRKEDGVADFRLPARAIEGRVRGFDPWPGVWARGRKGRIRIVEALAKGGSHSGSEPGRVLAFEDGALLVGCGEGTILAVRSVQPESRRALPASDAVHGRIVVPGDLLESGI